MNQRTELLNTSYKPELSIMVYRAGDGVFESAYYLESHQIDEKGRVLEGKPLDQQTIQAVVDTFYSEQRERSLLAGLIPDNLLFYKPQAGGNYDLGWYHGPEQRYFHFAKALRIPSAKMWTPALLYFVKEKELNVYAFKKDGRPDEKTKLFRAPFHNINEAGEVCLGNASVKKPTEKTFAAIIKYWEDLFWLSEFSHLNGATNPTKSELKKVYEQLQKSKGRKKWSDLDELKESKQSIQKLLS